MDINIIILIVTTIIFIASMFWKLKTTFQKEAVKLKPIKSKTIKEFLTKVKGHCSDSCFVAYYSVRMVQEIIKKYGLKKALVLP